METKQCLLCLSVLPLSDFYKKSKDANRRDTRCRHCRSAHVRKYRKENPEIVKAIQKKTNAKHAEKHKARAKQWYNNNKQTAKEKMAARRKDKPDLVKCASLRNSFGITHAQYLELMAEQNNACKICGTNTANLKRMLAVDHCHTSGKIRGLLCSKCNCALGLLNESIPILNNAIDYLKNNKSHQQIPT